MLAQALTCSHLQNWSHKASCAIAGATQLTWTWGQGPWRFPANILNAAGAALPFAPCKCNRHWQKVVSFVWLLPCHERGTREEDWERKERKGKAGRQRHPTVCTLADHNYEGWMQSILEQLWQLRQCHVPWLQCWHQQCLCDEAVTKVCIAHIG